MQEITLSEILSARDRRQAKQKELISTFSCPLICFTMNIAGPIKNSPLIERAFKEGLITLENKIPKKKILASHIDISATGCEAFLAVSMNAKKLKDICISIEDSCSLGRLFDMDVINTDEKKLERKNMRGCIVCNAPGRTCAAGRLHSVSQLQAVTQKNMHQHFLVSDRKKIADLATKSLLDEVYTTPKPGLVDRRNCGSHRDMDIETFVRSSNALAPYFYECVAIGQETSNYSPDATFKSLRQAGINAEKAMYQATGGVNTHKGAIYSIGIICGALGRLWTPENPIANTKDIFSLCSKMTCDAVKSDFASIDGSTAGGKLFLEYGLRGIRGEVTEGFPSVSSFSLPAYQNALDIGMSFNDAGVIALLHLISNVEDTNLYHRGGRTGALYAKDSVKALLENTDHPSHTQIEELDDIYIKKNLSPGGCADLLAVTYFIHELQKGL